MFTLITSSLRGMPSLVLSSALLVAFNMIPLFGVLYLGWDLFSILVLYWIESGIVGVINVFKIRRAEGPMTASSVSMTINGRRVAPSGAALSSFFVLHYGIFWLVHGLFVFLLPLFAGAASFGTDPSPGSGPRFGYANFDFQTVGFGALGLAASHVLSYWFNFIGQGEYKNVSAASQTLAPYGRVVFMHIIVVTGAWFVLGSDATPLIAFMVLLKTGIDLALHVWEHRRAGRPSMLSMGSTTISSGDDSLVIMPTIEPPVVPAAPAAQTPEVRTTSSRIV